MASSIRTGTTTADPGDLGYAEAFKNLQRALNGKSDEVPEGYFTTEQWRKMQGGVGRWAVQQTLHAGVEQGSVDKKNFRIRMPDGTIRAVPHYKVHGLRDDEGSVA